jgi:3-oxoadipate enol-lactonase
MASTQFLELPGARIAYDVSGEGAAVVLMHAWIADSRMWDELVPTFARHRRVVRYDKRGYGQTLVHEAVPYSNRRDLVDVLDRVGIERAALVGVSGGAVVALDTAIEFPDRVAALVAVAPGISGFDSGATPAEQVTFETLEGLEDTQAWPELVDGEMAVWVDGLRGSSDRVPEVRRRVAEMDLDAYRNHAAETIGPPQPLDPPATGRLSEVRIPTLTIVGDLDTSGTIASARRIAAEVPGARLVEWAGVAHLPPMERPAVFVELVEGFLDDAGA